MRYIFCKGVSSASLSVEHIIPESLGNEEHTLPPGVVCDRCNNYFARKVEKPLLETSYFRHLKFQACVKNKKGKTPKVLGMHLQSLTPIELFANVDRKGISIAAANLKDEARFVPNISTSDQGTLIVPVPVKPDERLMSRFLCKIALEALALRLLNIPGGLKEIVDKPEIDVIRSYARQGSPVSFWPYHERQLYPHDYMFYEAGYDSFEILHEWTFLYTEGHEIYFVAALFGVEYAISLGGPEIEGYHKWLSLNCNQSPLYPNGIEGLEKS
jgi:hypothetical protein